jgi:Big-like domain-containing protein
MFRFNQNPFGPGGAWKFRLALALFLTASSPAFAGAVHALFNLATPAGGPFPSDQFTVADSSQNTHRRVSLPLPDCIVRRSDCEDLGVINQLDGFNVQPRLSISFDSAIDLSTVNSSTVFLIRLGRPQPGSKVVGINQVVWDPPTNTLHAESEELLDQHTRYALIVTNGIRDSGGAPVEASEAFQRFPSAVSGDYREALRDALDAAREIGIPQGNIVTASAFTTQSVTAVLEKIRDQIKASTPAPADFHLGAGGSRTVFPLGNVSGLTWHQQRTVGSTLTDAVLSLATLRVVPGAVGRIAFGKYLSPDYEVHPGEYIPYVPTRTGVPAVQGMNEVYFNLSLPSGSPPPHGWPVMIFAHGGGGNKNTTNFNATMAAHGIATITINIPGHGFGPFGTLTVSQAAGGPVTFPAGGRGIDQNGDGMIADREGLSAAPPRIIIDDRDGFQQAVVDLMELVRVIEVGVDVDGDGFPDLDPSRISFLGYSLGGIYGTLFLAVEPDVQAGTIVNAGGPRTSRRLLVTPGAPRAYSDVLSARTPSLINAPGIDILGGLKVSGPRYNEDLPLRDGLPLAVHMEDGTSRIIQSPVISTASGAMEIQEAFENTDWVSQSGNAVAYARFLRRNPLAGVPARPVLILFAKGDQGVTNPAETALIRAGDLADRATLYRNDLAYAEDPLGVLKNPHLFGANITNLDPLVRAIAAGTQEQIATFFTSGGTVVLHPEPARFFETPVALPLPEDLAYIP